jgi:hypothetical protein
MLIDTIIDNCKIVSIVGMAKNAGKTVALNSLIQQSIDYGITIGITSTGRDGEQLDIVTNTEKPLIFVPEGTLVATASDCIHMGDAKLEILNVTDYSTPLGNIVIGRVKEEGYIQIAGPQTTGEIKKVCNQMLCLGAQIAVIDGAINRMASASPTISDGTILSTGAVISRNMNKVIEETVHTVELFNLPEIEDEGVKKIIKGTIGGDRTALIDKNNNIIYLDIRTALSSGNIIGSSINDDIKYVVIPGALVKRTLDDIVNTCKRLNDVKFILKDGTRVFIGYKDWQRFKRLSIKVEVLNRMRILAVTVNPYSPSGYYFEPNEFLLKMKNHLKDIPVFDMVSGGE